MNYTRRTLAEDIGRSMISRLVRIHACIINKMKKHIDRHIPATCACFSLQVESKSCAPVLPCADWCACETIWILYMSFYMVRDSVSARALHMRIRHP